MFANAIKSNYVNAQIAALADRLHSLAYRVADRIVPAECPGFWIDRHIPLVGQLMIEVYSVTAPFKHSREKNDPNSHIIEWHRMTIYFDNHRRLIPKAEYMR